MYHHNLIGMIMEYIKDGKKKKASKLMHLVVNLLDDEKEKISDNLNPHLIAFDDDVEGIAEKLNTADIKGIKQVLEDLACGIFKMENFEGNLIQISRIYHPQHDYHQLKIFPSMQLDNWLFPGDLCFSCFRGGDDC